MENSPLEIIGHRGAAGLAPENTWVAFQAAADLNLAWVEFDVVVTSDDVAVIFHDETLERCSDSSGLLREKSWSDLASIDVGRWFGPQYAGQQPVVFADLLPYLAQRSLGSHIELKLHVGVSPERLVAAAGAILAGKMNENMIVSAFNPRVLTLFHEAFPQARTAILLETELPHWQEWVQACGAEAVHIDDDMVTADFVSQCRELGLTVRVYTVNDPSRAALLSQWGVAGIFTDFPNRFVA